MKFAGKVVSRPEPVEFKFFRGDEEYTIVCNAVLDDDEFEKLCPEPKKTVVTTFDNGKQKKKIDHDDPKYLEKVNKYYKLRAYWGFYASIRDTPGMEFEYLKPNEPDSWLDFEKEMSFLTQPELNVLLKHIEMANLPTAERQKQAKENFTSSGPEEEADHSILEDVLENITSGEPVNDSV